MRPLSRYQETNVEGAARVCDAVRENGIRRIVFTSSVSVYGFQPRPVDESEPFAPFNEYGKTKLEVEGVYRAWAAEDASRTLVIVRPTVVFGEGNRGNVYSLIHQIASRRFLMVGAGENIKSIACVGSVAAFLAHTLSLGPGEHIFNYVDGPDRKTRELVDQIRRGLGHASAIRHTPIRRHGRRSAAGCCGVSFRRIFPISAIRMRKFPESTQFRAERAQQTGFAAPYSLSEGLERTIRFEFPRT